MVRRAFTLIELILVLVILSFLTVGGFLIIEKILKRNYIAKTASKFEFASQEVLDQVSEVIYYRVPLSAIGYNPSNHDFKRLDEIQEDENYSVVEWISDFYDGKKERNLSGFVDLYASSKPNLYTLDFNDTFLNSVLGNKGEVNITEACGLIFAGSFDRGDESAIVDYNNSFGWHGHKAKYVFPILSIKHDGNYTVLELNTTDKNSNRIYEKFYLADTAYAIALKKDLNSSAWNCTDLAWNNLDDNDLLFFYNYRPWDGGTFCGDDNGTPEGNVTLLGTNVVAFKVRSVNTHLELKITMFKSRADINVSISKQKVAF